MKIVIPAFLLFVFLILYQSSCPALELNKGLPHYAREMEFYYLKPRPEILPLLFQNFSAKGVLDKSENRLMLAAFFSELAKNGDLDLGRFLDALRKAKKNERHTLAWTIHLSGSPEEEELLAKVLQKDEKVLARQIRYTPGQLLDWQIHTDTSVLKMYWAAFMARGNIAYLDRIIDAALACIKKSEAGGVKRDECILCSVAGASLYDLAKTHEKVRERVKQRMDGTNEKGKKVLQLILQANPG